MFSLLKLPFWSWLLNLKSHTMNKLIIGFFLFVLAWQLQAANTLKIGTYQVLPNAEFTVQLVAENTDPFVAFQVDIPIPTGFNYVDGSAVLNASRISGHALSASLLDGNILRLIGYSIGNTPFIGNSGSLTSFSLKSGTVPATYALTFNQPVLSDSQSNNILTNSSNGSVTVLAPNISLSASGLDFGRVPLGSIPIQNIQITNNGNSNLNITGLNFNDSQFTTTTTVGFSIAANNSVSIPVKFSPTVKGTFAKQLQITSNDPDQPIVNINLNAVTYAVNEIHAGNISGASSTTKTLEFTLNNMEAYTGFQFDLNLPTPITYATGTAQLFRSQDQTVSVNQLNAQTLRVLVFSTGNKNFTGTSGKVLSLDFLLYGTAGYYSIGISNVIIANTNGENIVSNSFGGQLVVTCPRISASTQLNFGDVSILSNSTLQHRVYNYGEEPLIISKLEFSSNYFKSNQTLPITIQPNNYIDLPIIFADAIKGSTTGTLKITNNDPANTPFTVQLSGNAFIPNYFLINSQNYIQGESKSVAIEVENEESFVALQFDLSYPVGFTPDLNAITLTDRKQDHVLAATALSNSSLRILVYSPGLKIFSGNSGPILTIPFKAETKMLPGDYNLIFSNAAMSNTKSENILYSPKNAVLKVVRLNHAPVSNAEIDQSVNENTVVTLDGSASTDADNDGLTYKWTAPTGITLSSTTAAKPTFTAPEVSVNTDYSFSLVVNDGTVDSPVDQIVVTVKQVNKAPVANAGIDQSVNKNALVTLDGSASTDADNDGLTYKWTAPIGITLSSTTVAKPTFTAPEVSINTNYTFSLTVNDGTVDSPVDQVVVTVKQVNKAPVANAGIDQSVNENTVVTLDGSASTDADNDGLTYKWTAPTGITLSSTTVAKPTFTAPEVSVNTNYTFSLIVNDGTVDSPVDEVIITVNHILTGINQIDQLSIQIYPNPVMDSFRINEFKGDALLKLIDINGKELITKKITNNESVSISNLPKGIYFVKLITTEGIAEQRIIKK